MVLLIFLKSLFRSNYLHSRRNGYHLFENTYHNWCVNYTFVIIRDYIVKPFVTQNCLFQIDVDKFNTFVQYLRLILLGSLVKNVWSIWSGITAFPIKGTWWPNPLSVKPCIVFYTSVSVLISNYISSDFSWYSAEPVMFWKGDPN